MTGRAACAPAALARLTCSVGCGCARGLLRAAEALPLWLARHRDRRKLETLSDHLLKDAGLSRADMDREARKPF